MSSGSAGDPGVAGAQGGWDLVVLELAGKVDLEEEQGVQQGQQAG